jgi:hypothetical protein
MCLFKWMRRTLGTSENCQEKKADVISTRRKLQRDVGRFQAIIYFIDTKEKTLPWAEVLFCNGKVDSDSQNADRTEYSSRLVKELTSSRVMCGEFFDFG